MLQSLWLHNPNPEIHVYLIFDNVDSHQFGQAASYLHELLPAVTFLQASLKPLEGFPVNGHATVATYFRLLLPELLPPSVNRAIFIDADTTVLDTLQTLWNLPLQGHALAAVPEHRNSCLDHGYEFGEYFNAGIMLIDLSKWRQANLLERGRIFAIENPTRMRHWDQDVLNHVFNSDWLALADRWNACPHLYGLAPGYENVQHTQAELEAISNPAIVHFAGSGTVKPWNARCYHPFKGSYLQAKAQTPWADMPLEDMPPPRWKQHLDDAIFQSKCFVKDLMGSAS